MVNFPIKLHPLSHKEVGNCFSKRSYSMDPKTLASGQVHCQILATTFPRSVELRKVKNGDYNRVGQHNWKLFHCGLAAIGVEKDFETARLLVLNSVEMKYLNKWIIHLVDLNEGEKREQPLIIVTPTATRNNPNTRMTAARRAPSPVVRRLAQPRLQVAVTPSRPIRPPFFVDQTTVTRPTPSHGVDVPIIERTATIGYMRGLPVEVPSTDEHDTDDTQSGGVTPVASNDSIHTAVAIDDNEKTELPMEDFVAEKKASDEVVGQDHAIKNQTKRQKMEDRWWTQGFVIDWAVQKMTTNGNAVLPDYNPEPIPNPFTLNFEDDDSARSIRMSWPPINPVEENNEEEQELEV